MIEQDYLMRMIKDLVRFLAKIFFNKDTVAYDFSYEKHHTESDYLHNELLHLIELGKINEAEDLLFDKFNPVDRNYIQVALDFYNRLNDLDDEFLDKCDFPRAEIEQGLKSIARKLGVPL